MSLPSDSDGETIYTDSEYSEDETIHDSDLDFIDDSDSDTDSDSDSDSGNKCVIFKSTVIIR